MKKYLIACLLLLIIATSFAQGKNYITGKEKIYVQTNHVFFKPGETMFFKMYVVKAKDQTPSWQSPVVYAELINPAGNVMQKSKYQVTDGYAEGSFDLGEEAKGGIYKIRAYTTWMRNESDSSFFVKEITVQKVITPRILMKLDFPEKGYGAGNEVTADFSMRNLSDQPIKFYAAKFSVSVGGAIIQTETIKTDKDGKAKIKFTLPKELKTTDGLLNLTVNYDSYTEAISRSIPIVLNHIDLQFMPEGGTMVAGLPTWVAFKALNENGKPVDVKGEVLNSEGRPVATFESYHGGMGKFAFTPQKGTAYNVKVTSPSNITDTYRLPAANDAGVVMHVSRSDGKISVQLTTTMDIDVHIAAEVKGQLYDQKNLALHAGKNEMLFDEVNFPVGIARFTLSAANGFPLAERLVFLNEQRNLQVRITTDKKKYLPRELVNLHIQTLDANGKPVPANLSLSVVDDQLWSFADDKQDHILSWLLMSSELHGKIDEPQFYFKKEEAKAVPSLDLLMLTHGYRYFDYIADVNEDHLKFMPEEEQVVSGMVTNAEGRPVKANVFLMLPGAGGQVIQSVTDTTGVFFFSGLNPATNYYLMAQAISRKEQAFINIMQKDLGYNPLRSRDPRVMDAAKGEVVTALGIRRQAAPVPQGKNAMAFDMVADKHLALQEVVVIGYGVQRKRDMTGAVARIDAKDLVAVNRLMPALEGRIPGLQVWDMANPLDASKVNVRGIRTINGNNQPLIVIDGLPAEQFGLNNLGANDIESITVLKDASAMALYGYRATNGVVVIETKKFRNEKIRINLARPFRFASQLVRLDGSSYSIGRHFYAPKYTEVDVDDKVDFRSTVYWNPVVQTDRNGKAELSYYNSDASTTFRIIAEGIGYQGLVGRNEQTYIVKNAMSIDAKIPPYLTVGDRARLPLIIRNNRTEPVHLSLSLLLPENLKAGSYPQSIDVPADSSLQVIIPVEATAAVNGKVQFVVEGNGRRQTITLPITASDKGFPVVLTYAGNRSAKHDVTINQPVPGTVHVKTKIFRDLEGQLLDGIESMLHEPSGCFEQTSSSTYPNIYVLKYLKESGRSNPEIEKKALAYINAGYKRLVGFETSMNGFEWFGHAPAHEALTAYGLLEFTDMQEFVSVDREMLARTKDFLMSRRDGNGSFKLASGGYDRFASVPDKIANIYIVYALTQAGIGREIEPEYKTAVNKALASKDGYQLALMALAASNMKNEKDFRVLMNILDEQYRTSKLNPETSVVNSRETSLKVETLSLYALALMREQSPRMADIAEIISNILSTKTYYGYGATQATVLALQAIVTYSKLRGRLSENSEINFALNNQATNNDEEILAALKEGKNNISVGYGPSTSAIPYSIEIAYHTLTPPSSDRAELKLSTQLASRQTKVGETVRMDVMVHNERSILQPMAVAKIGIPAGLSVQPWQLKEILEKNEVAYYEIFDNYLVFYWMGFAPSETKTIHLDLKAEIAGTYKAKASNTYLYYTPEFKHWNEGAEVTISE
jgi:TonB-dependent SusC/RagA subfamily outer membrane receptor